MNKTELKKTMQAALYLEYGFKPSLSDITLLEGSGDGAYILARINSHTYRFNSFTGQEQEIWTGDGTITKED